MKSLILLNCVTLVCLSSLLHAQDTSTADKVKKQIPTNQKGIEENAKQLSKRALLNKRQRKAMVERAALVRKQHAEYLAGIKSGKINPYQRFFDAYPEVSTKVEKIKQQHQYWLKESNAKVKSVLEAQLLKDIQEVGIWLQIGEYVKSYDGKFDKASLAEFERLERHPERHPVNLSKSKLKLEYNSPTAIWYTVQHLSVPISCKAPAGARVFLQAMAGGEFENGLSIIEKVADENGNVSTYWVSKGDTIGLSQVRIVSPACSNTIHYNMNVIQPMINFPAYLNAKRMKQLIGQSPEHINQMLSKFTQLDISKLKERAALRHSNKK